MSDLFDLPKDIPIPQDDGACDHLTEMLMPKIELCSTNNRIVDLSSEAQSPTIVFFIPELASHQSLPLQIGI